MSTWNPVAVKVRASPSLGTLPESWFSGAISPDHAEAGSVAGEERLIGTNNEKGYRNLAATGQYRTGKSQSTESYPRRGIGGSTGGLGNAFGFDIGTFYRN
jgi:hypothetical protein